MVEFNRIMKKLFRILSYIVLFIVIIGISVSIYVGYKDSEYSKERLLFGVVDDEKWKWQDEFNRIQMRSSEDGLQLRQVSIDRRSYSIISISKEHELEVLNFFKADCKPGTKIKENNGPWNTVKDNGDIYLYCTKDGEWLMANVSYSFPQVSWSKRYQHTKIALSLGVFNSELSIPNPSLELLEREYIFNKAVPSEYQK
jgi:hypothetical protein